MFEEAVRAASQLSFMPACTIREKQKGSTVRLPVPGASPGDRDVSMTMVSARPEASASGRRMPHLSHGCRQEIPAEAFVRSFSPPSLVHHAAGTASYRDRLLTIRFPKLESAKPRRLFIESQ